MTPSKALTAPPAPWWAGPAPLDAVRELAVPVAVLAIVVALITPLPGFVLDLLIAADMLASVTVMMVSLYLVRPVEFTSFPTTLLLLTLFRLALNVSSSRLILLKGNTGTTAAGQIIGAFGSFVVGGNYIIGAVIFLVLIAIQYVVINHGAVRISEVTARFTLDALPGQTDVHRFGPERGSDRRIRGQAAPQATGHRSRVLRGHGRGFALHPARRGGQHPDHQHQYHRRVSDRRPAARDGVSQGARNLHRADHRRWAGDRNSGADDFDIGGPDRHPRQFRRPAGHGVSAADFRPLAAAAAGSGGSDDPGRAAFHAQDPVSVVGRRGGLGRMDLAPPGTSPQASRRRKPSRPPRRTWKRFSGWNRWPSRWGSGWWGWSKGRRNRRYCAGFRPSGGNWLPIWATCCRR